MLNFNQFRIFYHVAKHRNFTRAASDLFISQPAVTAQMKAFEAYCGLKLFKKKGRKNWLTYEGNTLFEYAKTIFVLEKDIENAIDDMRELKRGVLRIGTTKAYARYFMPLMLSTFHIKYPDIGIELNEGSSLEMTLSLLDFKNEVALIAKAGDVSGIRFIPFSREEMVVIAAPDHPLTRRGAIFFRDLTDEPFIMKDKGSGTRKLVDRLFAHNNCTPNILMEVSNAEFIKQLVQRGDGVSFLVREAVAAELSDGKLAAVPLKGKKVYLDVSIAYLEGQHLSPSAKAFIDTLEKLQFGKEITPQGIGVFMAKILSQQNQKK
ncbi:MAG: LysR family transcriptional regulator [Bacteroidota bacterium]|nr:LysR family transcriptional regulator [Bacteroidota bacterium]